MIKYFKRSRIEKVTVSSLSSDPVKTKHTNSQLGLVDKGSATNNIVVCNAFL